MAAVVFFVVPPALVLVLFHNSSSADPIALGLAVAQGAGFSVFAAILGRSSAKQAKDVAVAATDVADAAIISATEELSVGGARSLLRSEDQALMVAPRARAALRHFVRASRDRRDDVIKSIRAAYADLAFGVFSRADGLSRSMWTVLLDDGASVRREIEETKARLPPSQKSDHLALAELSDYVSFVVSIGAAIRQRSKTNRFASGPLALPHEPWQRDAANWVRHLQTLYETELTVKKDWSVITNDIEDFTFSVVLEALPAGEHMVKRWAAPWYLDRDFAGHIGPVNVAGARLGEHAQYDMITQADPPPALWPHPLQHSILPSGLREQGIAEMADLMSHEKRTQTTCVLAYEFTNGAERQRVILDGNHRLAAAYELSRPIPEDIANTDVAGSKRPMRPIQRVLTFLISEAVAPQGPVDAKVPGEQGGFGPWYAFTPDIGLIRGTWRPHRAKAVPELTGAVTPGNAVTVSNGVWMTIDKTVVATEPEYSYQWLVDGEPVPNETEAIYKVRDEDKGHELSAQVLAKTVDAWVSAESMPTRVT